MGHCSLPAVHAIQSPLYPSRTTDRTRHAYDHQREGHMNYQEVYMLYQGAPCDARIYPFTSPILGRRSSKHEHAL